MGIVHSFEKGLDFWADAAVALGDSLPHQTRIVPQGDMGYGVKATVTIEQGSKVAAYLLTGLSYIDPTCDTPLVYSFNLPLVKACGTRELDALRAPVFLEESQYTHRYQQQRAARVHRDGADRRHIGTQQRH